MNERRLPIDEETWLRTPDITDAPQFWKVVAQNRAELAASFKWVGGISDIASAIHFIGEEKKRLAAEVAEPFLLFKSGDLVGAVSLMLGKSGEFEVGYFLDKALRGRGLARTAVARVLNYGFYDLGLLHAQINTSHLNFASQRLAERLGFTYQQTTPGTWLEGQADTMIYSLSEPELMKREDKGV